MLPRSSSPGSPGGLCGNRWAVGWLAECSSKISRSLQLTLLQFCWPTPLQLLSACAAYVYRKANTPCRSEATGPARWHRAQLGLEAQMQCGRRKLHLREAVFEKRCQVLKVREAWRACPHFCYTQPSILPLTEPVWSVWSLKLGIEALLRGCPRYG